MPRFIHAAGEVELSCSNDSGRKFCFKFPYVTNSPTEITMLRKMRGVEEVESAVAPAPNPEPEPASPVEASPRVEPEEHEPKPAPKAMKTRGGDE
jgi:hypothetical protein